MHWAIRGSQSRMEAAISAILQLLYQLVPAGGLSWEAMMEKGFVWSVTDPAPISAHRPSLDCSEDVPTATEPIDSSILAFFPEIQAAIIADDDGSNPLTPHPSIPFIGIANALLQVAEFTSQDKVMDGI